MTVSIRSVLHNTQFKRADPVVEVEGKDLDTPVRWVFTNEREDVSSFLSGGEMLIIEGKMCIRDRVGGARCGSFYVPYRFCVATPKGTKERPDIDVYKRQAPDS